VDAEVREVLVGMKTELSKGWVQKDLIREDGVCLYGAVIAAAGIEPQLADGDRKRNVMDVKGRNSANPILGADGRRRSASLVCVSYTFSFDSPAGRAMRAISAEVGVGLENLALWNDESGRTVDEIVAAIDRILLRDEAAPGRRIKLLRTSNGKVPTKV
jgi:hypothetical protein